MLFSVVAAILIAACESAVLLLLLLRLFDPRTDADRQSMTLQWRGDNGGVGCCHGVSAGETDERGKSQHVKFEIFYILYCT